MYHLNNKNLIKGKLKEYFSFCTSQLGTLIIKKKKVKHIMVSYSISLFLINRGDMV